MRLADKIAIVTGAASGFGEAIARKRVAQQIESSGGRAIFLRSDVSQSEDVRRLVEGCVEQLGGLDIIVNNAGVPHRSMPMEQLPEDEYDRVMREQGRAVVVVAPERVYGSA